MSERAEERSRLLDAIEAACRNDPRVAGAWLIGSLGGGTEDDWSDLDVWVVPQEGCEDTLLKDLSEAVGEPRLRLPAPQNAPAGGEFLTTAYDAPTGPHLVDWYLQPLAYAAGPRTERTLVLRADLPEIAPPAPPRQRHATALHSADAFWATMLLQSKALARGADRLEFEDALARFVETAPAPGDKPLERLRAFSALGPPHAIRPAVERHLDYVEKALG